MDPGTTGASCYSVRSIYCSCDSNYMFEIIVLIVATVTKRFQCGYCADCSIHKYCASISLICLASFTASNYS